MAKNKNFGAVVVWIKEIYGKKAVAAIALCQKYQQKAEQTAKNKQGTTQGSGNYWTNQTGDAVQGIKGYAGHDHESAWWGVMHTEEYGIWLELEPGAPELDGDTGRRNPAAHQRYRLFKDTMTELQEHFYSDLRKIFG